MDNSFSITMSTLGVMNLSCFDEWILHDSKIKDNTFTPDSLIDFINSKYPGLSARSPSTQSKELLEWYTIEFTFESEEYYHWFLLQQ